METWLLVFVALLPAIAFALIALAIYVSRMQPFDHNHYD